VTGKGSIVDRQPGSFVVAGSERSGLEAFAPVVGRTSQGQGDPHLDQVAPSLEPIVLGDAVVDGLGPRRPEIDPATALPADFLEQGPKEDRAEGLGIRSATIWVDHYLDTPALVPPAEVSVADQATRAHVPSQGPGADGRPGAAGIEFNPLLLTEGGMSIDGGSDGEKLGDVGLVERPQSMMYLDLDSVHGCKLSVHEGGAAAPMERGTWIRKELPIQHHRATDRVRQ
jgi:hypothetical protein